MAALIGPDTIATIPPDTLRLFQDHGVIEQTLPGDVGEARRIMNALSSGGIDFADVNRTLEEEGIGKFTRSLDKLLGVIRDKRNNLTRNARAGRRAASG